MQKRILILFCSMLAWMSVAIFRIYYINMTDALAVAADRQSKYTLQVATTRGSIYDRNRREMVNREYTYIAAVMPTPAAVAALLAQSPEEQKEGIASRMAAAVPFAINVEEDNIYAKGVDVFRVPRRYGRVALAAHVIGYLDGEGRQGVAGIERAYNDWLQKYGSGIQVRYEVDAAGRVLEGGRIAVERSGEASDMLGGVILTLDLDFQLVCQNALESSGVKGAAVVMEAQSGNILAMSSRPAYDQNDIAASLQDTDAPFINRALSGYNIGSAFKVLVAAAALEYGVGQYYPYTCEGVIDVGGQVFRCNNHAVHGQLDMQRALQVSCNTYFIHLAQQVPEGYMLAFMESMGLGKPAELAPGLVSQSGNLPDAAELANPAAYANFSFGQGSSLATPLQMAQAVCAIANGGYALPPRLVQGLTEDGLHVTYQPVYSASQVLSKETASLVRQLMVGVINDGSGRTAKPFAGGAGGKTSSAQTGQFVDGVEIVHAWFAGFYPAEQPRYAIVVFVEGGESGEKVAAPIFKQIADGISGLE